MMSVMASVYDGFLLLLKITALINTNCVCVSRSVGKCSRRAVQHEGFFHVCSIF